MNVAQFVEHVTSYIMRISPAVATIVLAVVAYLQYNLLKRLYWKDIYPNLYLISTLSIDTDQSNTSVLFKVKFTFANATNKVFVLVDIELKDLVIAGGRLEEYNLQIRNVNLILKPTDVVGIPKEYKQKITIPKELKLEKELKAEVSVRVLTDNAGGQGWFSAKLLFHETEKNHFQAVALLTGPKPKRFTGSLLKNQR